MEGEKERERERGEEKESDETEEEEREKESDEEEEEDDAEGAAMVWQEGYGEDDLGLPIMHWEALSLRIAELEKQEEERKEKSSSVLERSRVPMAWAEARERGRSRETWEEGEEDGTSRVTALTSRLQTQTNLQLCFINNSESEEEEEEENTRKMVTGKKGAGPVPQAPPTGNNSKSSGFKFEVRAALGALRDKLRTEQKKERPVSSESLLGKRRRLDRSDLVTFSSQELQALHSSLGQAIQDLSEELVGRLQTRDQLRTEQDAMLLEVQDMTSL
ncbi:cilia- and flagella-associated protein 251 [Hypomesus transpacificus]|uniref:cilia- and flagella-associated protein 251 n=1 Tax=Hypomesus transpacificus TaxID=137520 RepID=UPI001F07FF59|nr:cilia- and flagella-associated protein 251 [Hypomesus transpacificus]XP_046872900.1 cilia- and flagella-associated protein 251 [Hypomesus transpacificus]